MNVKNMTVDNKHGQTSKGTMVRVRVPASTANLGPGFDSLGMALQLYTWIEMDFATETSIELYGEHMQGIAVDKSNLIYKVAQKVFAKSGHHIPEIAIKMKSDIPLARGLGSSAAAIVGGMVAANALVGSPLSKHELFQMATELEDHPDNVGASLFGGFVVATWADGQAEYIKIPPNEQLNILVAIPDFQLKTDKAREVLPRQLSLQDAIYNISHTALLVAALSSGDLNKLKVAMTDRLHQPYRSKLIPGMDRALSEAVHHGALGVALSGAGPTLLAFTDGDRLQSKRVEQFLKDCLIEAGNTLTTLWLKPATEGVFVLTGLDRSSTLFQNVKGEFRA